MRHKEIFEKQKEFYLTGKTKEIAFRLESLRKLQSAIKRYEPDITTALKKDLHRSEFDAYLSEIGPTLDEIKYVSKRLKTWAKPRKVPTPQVLMGSKSYVYPEPYGLTLIISPWNYPFNLAVMPLIGAIAAGNCVTLKPSEWAPHTSQVIMQMIKGIFEEEYIAVIEGDVETSKALLDLPFDHIFFTGSAQVGKTIMEKAAQTLTPVTLELGGKSPVIIDKDANIELAARRIVWGKWLNAGQTCVAPDYVLIHEERKDVWLAQLKQEIARFYGKDPLTSENYGHIVNERHFSRLEAFLADGEVVIGGKTDAQRRVIEPTVLTGVSWEAPVMQEEIFGPILPVFTFTDLDEAIAAIRKKEKPLALYFFSENEQNQEKVIRSLPFGGGCINDTIVHIGNPHLPFGGVGMSGLGNYHGKYSFDCFSHEKAIVKQTTQFDMPLRYSFTKNALNWLKKFYG
ncbi:aldehyde dehydrogenase [Laceyella sacchari]|uniref:Aldehyde dehydrogenase n=1 Tax=Laceyella sacchari TaxID=37482 RepID=A0ABY5U1Q8_LACSH|nr:aldehyde dehydrogenase [Laceyella sacchari]UWE02950.1 aldehyde dehydrogenase [Laceyella sacchari]